MSLGLTPQPMPNWACWVKSGSSTSPTPNTYRCPAGETLTYRFDTVKKSATSATTKPAPVADVPIPLERTDAIFSDLYKHPLSEGSIVATCQAGERQVNPVNEAVKAHLIQTPAPVHFNETSAPVEGGRLC